jgi:hypothetical protein
MSCGLANHFEVYARCCQKLAEEAGTPELRDRLLQMAQEFMWATTRTASESLRDSREASVYTSTDSVAKLREGHLARNN